jgi:hypothetical protein
MKFKPKKSSENTAIVLQENHFYLCMILWVILVSLFDRNKNVLINWFFKGSTQLQGRDVHRGWKVAAAAMAYKKILPRHCRDGFQKNVSNFTAATVLDQKYW